MPPKDKLTLQNLVAVIVASTAVVLVVGLSFLQRGLPDPPPERASVRSSAGGVPTAPAGTTTITSAEVERGSSATGAPEVAPTTTVAREPEPQSTTTPRSEPAESDPPPGSTRRLHPLVAPPAPRAAPSPTATRAPPAPSPPAATATTTTTPPANATGTATGELRGATH